MRLISIIRKITWLQIKKISSITKGKLINDLDDESDDKLISFSPIFLVNRKGYCINENAGFREDKLNQLLKRLGMSKASKSSTSIKLTNGSSTKEEQDKPAIKPIKPDVKSKDLFASFKSKSTKDDAKKSNNKGRSVEIEDDVKKDEFVKLKNDKSTEKEDEKPKTAVKEDSSEDDREEIDDIEMNAEDEKIHRKASKPLKRTKTFDSDSDEDFIHAKENIKHKNKKQRKRVIDFDDSSDESNDQNGTIESKFESKTTNKPKEEESSRLVEEEETYTDEDGFKVHKTVKKIVKEDKKEPAIKKDEIKKKKEPSPSENKKAATTTKSKPAAKNQPSIMNFFKPKNQS